MKILADILAEDNGFDAIKIIFLLVFIVISIVASLIKKAAENSKKQQSEAEQRANRPVSSSQKNTDDELPQVGQPTRADRLYEQSRHRWLEHEKHEQFAHSVTVQPLTIQRQSDEYKTHVAGNKVVEETRVEQELQQVRSRQQKLDNQREQRMATAEPYNETTKAIEARLLHVPQADRSAVASGLNISLQLADLQQAKAAIVFHEIFSPPKALRHEAEMWDM